MWTAEKKKLKLCKNCPFFIFQSRAREQMLLGDSSASSKGWPFGSVGWLREVALTRKFVKGGVWNFCFIFSTPLPSSAPCRIFAF